MMLKRHFLSLVSPRINRVPNINLFQSTRRCGAMSPDIEAEAMPKPFEEMPSIKILPLIGTGWAHLPFIRRHDNKRIIESFDEKRKVLGNIYREKFGNINVIFSFNAEDLQVMYRHEGDYPVRSEMKSMKLYRVLRKDWYSSVGIIILNGKEWHDFRKRVQKHLMKPKNMMTFLDPMQDVAREFIQKIYLTRNSNKEVPNFLDELYKWGLESVALVGLDTRLGCLEKNLSQESDGVKMIHSVQTMNVTMNKLEAFNGQQLWKYFPTPTWKKFVKASDTFSQIAFKHINLSLERLKKASGDQDLTLLQSLLLEKGMDVSSAMVMVSDMLMAGIDTTSNSVGFFLYHMARNPEKQERLYQELKRILPNKEDKLTPSVYNELKYLKACIKEAQRLTPVVGVHVRILDHDVVFSGFRVPAQTILLMCVQAIYKDERYFSNPNAYLPERWVQREDNFHPFAFLPFGFGVRSCIGRRLAELEMISFLTELIRNFKVEYHYEDIGIITRLINAPDKPLKFQFIER